jgi:hypothetical protein
MPDVKSDDGQHIPDLKLEERLRLAFTWLGATFIKLGHHHTLHQSLGLAPLFLSARWTTKKPWY